MNDNRRSRLILLTIFIFSLTAILTSCSSPHADTTNTAVPSQFITGSKPAVEINLSGVPNLHKVSDTLYRGAQPNEEGFRQLQELGIKTVVNLRSSHSDRDKLKGTNLKYEEIPMTAWHPKDEDVVEFLKIAADANLAPVFVHCKRGADRTGMMCAVYRVAVQDWPKEEAIKEMTKGGYGFYFIWQNIVSYIRKLDVEKIRQQAGIEISPVYN